jgi:hypothetical protein
VRTLAATHGLVQPVLRSLLGPALLDLLSLLDLLDLLDLLSVVLALSVVLPILVATTLLTACFRRRL